MTTPVRNFGAYTVTFDAEPEEISMRQHFIEECGWTPAQYKKIASCSWFCAKVGIWKDGEELATYYLGCCSYKTEKEFYTKYEGDYFADMVYSCAAEIKDPELLAAVSTWCDTLREKSLPK